VLCRHSQIKKTSVFRGVSRGRTPRRRVRGSTPDKDKLVFYFAPSASSTTTTEVGKRCEPLSVLCLVSNAEGQQGIGWARVGEDAEEDERVLSDSQARLRHVPSWPLGPVREPRLRPFVLCGPLLGGALGAWFGYALGRPDPSSYLSGESTPLAVGFGIVGAFIGLAVGLITWFATWHSGARYNARYNERRRA
jgi:hypothetical protein